MQDTYAPRQRSYRSDTERPLVDMRHVHVSFGGQPVLRDVSLQVPRGQTLVVIGESGCGKSVLLKTVIGLIQPTRGEVLIDGVDFRSLDEREIARQRTRFGFVFQQAALFDSLTIGENIAFPLRQQKNRKNERDINTIVLQRLAEVGLAKTVLDKRPAELSGGMRKRVGLARALVLDPEIVLYDEPTTGLDPIMSDVINELILRTKENTRVTSIVVTHDMNSARKVAQRIVMLSPVTRVGRREPQLIFDGTPEELERVDDKRVQQFTRGEAGDRLMEMRFEQLQDAQ
jgi:phospholipid/cholesterol/gamma-HCH transport system ATP-binding protein